MDFFKIEYRSVIKFLTLEKATPQEIFERLKAVYGEVSPSYTTVRRWAQMFKLGRTTIIDDDRSGRPIEITTDENVAAIEKLVTTERRLKVRELALEVGISTERVHFILTQKLDLRKICARWVPCLLTAEHKAYRVQCCQELLAMYDADPENFWTHLVTGDETWIHHYDPESKQESMEWHHRGSPPPLKAKRERSKNKLMASFFWDSRGVLLLDYLPRGSTLNSEYYCKILERLRYTIKNRRRGALTRGIYFQHDNASPHTSHFTTAALDRSFLIVVPHPPYSPDLAPSDFFLFRHLKKYLRGNRYADDSEMIAAVQDWLDSRPESFFLEGLMELKGRWEKCIISGGNYVEK